MKKGPTIALLGGAFLWKGGVEFLRNLANALLSVQEEHQIRLFLLLPVRNKVDTGSDLRGVIRRTAVSIVKERKLASLKEAPAYDSSISDYFENVDGVIQRIEYNESTGLIPALQRIRADVVMPTGMPFGKSFPFPWVGYIYDFQHKYYPRYFSADECLNRDIRFATMLRDAKAVIVNAQAVKDDIEKFFPYPDCAVFNLPFSAAPASSWLENLDPRLLDRYKLPPRYFLISNQFWVHKSHSTAFQALALLLQDDDYADLHIVCTGKMEDQRVPNHISDLHREIRDLRIQDNVHLLGHIPKIDQVAIMRNSLVLLQPTLFEGGPGGGSVYDAVSLGVPVIVSDIPVNKEIETEANVFYFKAGSAGDLAETIKVFLRKEISRPTKQDLFLRGEKRKHLMGARLLEAASYVVGPEELKSY